MGGCSGVVFCACVILLFLVVLVVLVDCPQFAH